MNNKCPHCNAILDPMPQRKTKCPSCGNDIFVGADPSSKQKILLTKQDALSLDAIKNLQISEKEFQEAKKKAPKNQSLRHTVWGLLNMKKSIAARKDDWQEVKIITWEQSRLLYLLGENFFPLLQEAMKHELLGCQRIGVKKVKILTSKDDRTCEKCASQDGMAFTIDEALEKMPIPVKCDNDEMCRCVYTYEMK